MTTTLYYSRNPNPRLAVAVARYLSAPVTLAWCAPFDPTQASFFRSLNPTQRIPILVEDGKALWEADAIACRLSQMTEADFWRRGIDQPEMIRWLSWGKETFVRACDIVHFELGTKQRYHAAPVDPAKLAEGQAMFREAAPIIDAHLADQSWLVDDRPSYADFRMASFLPFNDVAKLPIDDYPNLRLWANRLSGLPFWDDPFAGLDAPPLPALRSVIPQSGSMVVPHCDPLVEPQRSDDA
jgi:glutathione S-transferase